jgi:small subunit ribosomal protein S1
MTGESNDIGSFDSSSAKIDDELQRELDAALGDQSIEQLMEASEPKLPQAPAEGDAQNASASDAGAQTGGGTDNASSKSGDQPARLVRGRITLIRGDDVFVELSGADGKNQGLVPLVQFERAPRVGSIMEFVVVRLDEEEGLITLSREGAVGQANWDRLSKGDLIEARVTGTNKGGLELELVGRIRGFMPASQVSLQHVENLDGFVGQKLTARVQDINRKGRSVVLSRRAHLEADRELKQKALWETLEVGQMAEGVVSRITDFGAFVDLGGMDGLVHVSDMSHSRVEKPQDFVEVGQTLQVKILKFDQAKNRISLGIKQTQPDPWEALSEQFKVGQEIDGKVTRTMDFGAFVEILPGVEGLLPISELSWAKVRRTEDVVNQGDNIRVVLMQVDPGKRRMTLTLRGKSEDPWTGAEHKFAAMSIVEGTVVSTTEFGAFVQLTPGIDGLVHISELADRRVNVVSEILKVGQTNKFRVLTIDEEKRKISLSLKQVKNPQKPKERFVEEKFPSSYTAKAKASGNKPGKGGIGDGGSMGTGLGGLTL